jgi:hypothetical protein
MIKASAFRSAKRAQSDGASNSTEGRIRNSSCKFTMESVIILVNRRERGTYIGGIVFCFNLKICRLNIPVAHALAASKACSGCSVRLKLQFAGTYEESGGTAAAGCTSVMMPAQLDNRDTRSTHVV